MEMQAIDIVELRSCVLYKPETGHFTRLVTTSPRGIAGKRADRRRSDGYYVVNLFGRRFEAARLAWLYMTGKWPIGDVDHKDGNPANNAWANLRDVPHRDNIENRSRANKSNKSGFLGVSKIAKTGRFRAQITIAGQTKWLGEFDRPEAAHAAYLEAKRLHHKGNML